jgi:hypothetical protein
MKTKVLKETIDNHTIHREAMIRKAADFSKITHEKTVGQNSSVQRKQNKIFLKRQVNKRL